MKRTSPWAATAYRPELGDSSFRELSTDIAVLGGGLVGLTTALLAARDGASVAVVEAGAVASGVTAQSTVKATLSHGTLLGRIVQRHGEDTCGSYVGFNRAGLDKLVGLATELARHRSDPGLRQGSHTLYATDAAGARQLASEVELAQRLGVQAEPATDSPPLWAEASEAAGFPETYAVHPATYVAGLAELAVEAGVVIMPGTTALGVDAGQPCRVETTAGTLTAGRVVVATHVPVLDRGLHFARYTQQREYGVAGVLPPGAPDPGMTYLVGSTIRSTRTVELEGEQLLIVVGESHPTGRAPDMAERPERLRRWATQRFGVADWRYQWSSQDVFPLDHLPWAGSLAGGQGRVLVASGFSAWGMTNGTAAALLLADLLAGRDNDWSSLVNPQRAGLSDAKPLVTANATVAKHFVTGRLGVRSADVVEQLKPGGAVIATVSGERAAAHRDESGALHVVSANCTHLGCVVRWNDAERSWDCPCHGSRFGIDGDVLHGPAVRPLKRIDPDASPRPDHNAPDDRQH